jgi:hypothetical protein
MATLRVRSAAGREADVFSVRSVTTPAIRQITRRRQSLKSSRSKETSTFKEFTVNSCSLFNILPLSRRPM